MDKKVAPPVESKFCGWSWGNRELICVQDLEREMLAPIEFPLAPLRWNGQMVADSEGLEAWMVDRGFYGHSLRDAGYVWVRGSAPNGAPFKGPLRALSSSDIDGLWREMSELAAQMELGELGVAASPSRLDSSRKPRV